MKSERYQKASSPLVLLLATPLFVSAAAAWSAEKTVVLSGARLIDGTGRPPIENAVLVIVDGRIRAVGQAGAVHALRDAERIDVRGKTVMPLLINLHGHLGQVSDLLGKETRTYTEENIRRQLERYQAYGVGTVLSLGSDEDSIYKLRAAQRAGSLHGARLYTAGRGFGVKGGYPPGSGSPPLLGDRYRPDTPEEARAEVRELATHHPDFVKMWVDDDFGRLPKMKSEIYRAIIDEAHRRHLRVAAHVFYLADAKGLIQAGIDGLAHSIRDQTVDRELTDAMKGRKIFLMPTLVRDESTFAFAEGPKWLDDPFFEAGLDRQTLATLTSPAFIEKFRSNPNLGKYRAAFEMAKMNLKTLFDAGVEIGFGTDSGPPLRLQGYFEHRELQLMVESGLSPMQAIVAATRASAEILGARDLGTLEPGKQADFVVLDANPLEDIHNTEKLSAVWHHGSVTKSIAAR